MAIALTFGNLTIDGCTEMAWTNSYRVTEHRFPRRAGSIAPRVPAKDSKHLSLICEVWKDTEAELLTYFESLNAKLDAGRDRLVVRDNGRFINVVPVDPDVSYKANSVPALHAFYSLKFLADDPYWYAPTSLSDSQTVGAVNVKNWTITNAGGARTPMVMEITRTAAGGDQANVLITNSTTGLYMKWTGTLTNGVKLFFDAVNKRVTVGGGNGLIDFSGTFLDLEPGANHLQYDGPQNVTIATTWMERWS